MTGSWIGPASAVRAALKEAGALILNDEFQLAGPEIEYLLRDASDDEDWEFIEVKPETQYLDYQGVLRSLVPLLREQSAPWGYALKVTAGLPIASRRQS